MHPRKLRELSCNFVGFAPKFLLRTLNVRLWQRLLELLRRRRSHRRCCPGRYVVHIPAVDTELANANTLRGPQNHGAIGSTAHDHRLALARLRIHPVQRRDARLVSSPEVLLAHQRNASRLRRGGSRLGLKRRRVEHPHLNEARGVASHDV